MQITAKESKKREDFGNTLTPDQLGMVIFGFADTLMFYKGFAIVEINGLCNIAIDNAEVTKSRRNKRYDRDMVYVLRDICSVMNGLGHNLSIYNFTPYETFPQIILDVESARSVQEKQEICDRIKDAMPDGYFDRAPAIIEPFRGGIHIVSSKEAA